jgi:hypothetical protein
MAHIGLSRNNYVETKERGWVCVNELSLKDEIRVLNWEYKTQEKPSTDWCSLYLLQCNQHAYGQFFVSSVFELVYEHAKIFLQKGKQLTDKSNQLVHMDWLGEFEDEKVTKFGARDSDFQHKVENCAHELYVLNEKLEPVVLNSDTHLHTKEHKIWDQIYVFYWNLPKLKREEYTDEKQRKRTRDVVRDNHFVSIPLVKGSDDSKPIYALNGWGCELHD